MLDFKILGTSKFVYNWTFLKIYLILASLGFLMSVILFINGFMTTDQFIIGLLIYIEQVAGGLFLNYSWLIILRKYETFLNYARELFSNYDAFYSRLKEKIQLKGLHNVFCIMIVIPLIGVMIYIDIKLLFVHSLSIFKPSEISLLYHVPEFIILVLKYVINIYAIPIILSISYLILVFSLWAPRMLLTQQTKIHEISSILSEHDKDVIDVYLKEWSVKPIMISKRMASELTSANLYVILTVFVLDFIIILLGIAQKYFTKTQITELPIILGFSIMLAILLFPSAIVPIITFLEHLKETMIEGIILSREEIYKILLKNKDKEQELLTVINALKDVEEEIKDMSTLQIPLSSYVEVGISMISFIIGLLTYLSF